MLYAPVCTPRTLATRKPPCQQIAPFLARLCLKFDAAPDGRHSHGRLHPVSSAPITSSSRPLTKMIIESPPTTAKHAEVHLTPLGPGGAPAPEELPPSFEQATEDRLLPSPPHQDPPPAFSTYTASFFTSGGGAIVSHDSHLNEDGACPVTRD